MTTNKKGLKRTTTKSRDSFFDAPPGPPVSWVPPLVSLSPAQLLPSMTAMGPHPS